MASKQAKLQQLNKQPRASSKLIAPSKQEHEWSFLECIDAPQWVDLALEACFMGKEGCSSDSWFDKSHTHHAISLAGLNKNMSWLRLGKSSQTNQVKGPVLSKNTSKGFQNVVAKSCKKHTVKQLHLNKYGQGRSQNQDKDLGVQKGVRYSSHTDRVSDDHLSLNSLNGSVDNGCTFSGNSSTSEGERIRSLRKHSFCSDRSSVNSSFQACSVESKKVAVHVWRGSSISSQYEESCDTPTHYIGGGRRNRSSSSASYCPSVPKSRYSSETGMSASTKSRCSSENELGVSTITKLQSVCLANCQSFGDSGVTSMSGASWKSEDQVSTGCARIWEESSDDARNVGELRDDQPLCRDSSTVDDSSYACQQMTKGFVNCGIKAGRRRLETSVSQAGPLLRKQLYAGKENAPPKGNLNLLQVKEKRFHSKGILADTSSTLANAKYSTNDTRLGGDLCAPQVSKKEGHGSAAQVVLSKSGVSQNVNGGRSSSVNQQRKRAEAKQVPVGGFVSEKTSKSERDLAALVAQHNQKIRTLGLQNQRKGLR